MKLIHTVLVAGALGSNGCQKQAGPPTLTPEEIAPAVQKSFLDAKPDAKALAAELADSIQHKDYPKAFLQSQDLGDRQDLSSDQRQASARAGMLVMQQLAAAAANGDQQAAEILKAYRASK